jgi:hypothetical protein
MNKFSDVWKARTPYNKDVGEWYIVRVNGIEHSRWPNEKEANMMKEELRAQGVFGTVICEYPLETKAMPLGDVKAGPAEEVNLCVEYKDSEGRVQYRFFNSDAELKQFKQEMGSEVTITQTVKGIHKEIVEKPAKFDRCVEHVKQNSPDANAYAVCNAMVSDKSFGEMESKTMNGLIDEALKAMGIDTAGPVPHSLLARQDLEGKKRKAADDSDDDTVTKSYSSVYDLASRIQANQKPSRASLAGSTFKDLWAKVRATNHK